MEESFAVENMELISGGSISTSKEMDKYMYGIMIFIFAIVYYLVVYSDMFRGFRESVRGFLKRLLMGSYISNGSVSTTKHVTWKDNVVQYILGDSDESDSDESYDSDDYEYE
jgi:hypothetical protein